MVQKFVKYYEDSKLLVTDGSSSEGGGEWTDDGSGIRYPATGDDYTKFETDGTQIAYGEATTWDDQQINLGEVGGSGWFGTPGVSIVEYRSGSALEFQDSTSDSYKARFNVQINHKYIEGEDIEFHIHIGNDSTSTGNAVFKLTYEWANMEDVFPSASSATKTISVDGVNGKHQMEEIVANISGTSKKISSILLCTLERLANDSNDTYSDSIYVIGLDYHVPMNSIGSKDIMIK